MLKSSARANSTFRTDQSCCAAQELNRGKAMRKTWMSAALVAALALPTGPLAAQQRAPTTGTHVVACSGTFAKDSSSRRTCDCI